MWRFEWKFFDNLEFENEALMNAKQNILSMLVQKTANNVDVMIPEYLV